MRRATVALAGILASIALTACGDVRGGTTRTVVQTVTAPGAPTAHAKHHRHRHHHKQAATGAPAAVAPEYVQCDPNISVKSATTSCGFAENVFYEYWTNDESDAIEAYSPAAGTSFAATCADAGATIVCRTARDAVVRFSSAALDAYDQSQADHYAVTHDLGPDTGAPSPSEATPADDGPTPDNEIPNYPNGTGSVVQCADGMYSHSGGRSGACSHHGGVAG
jgi:hypothetical protein